MQRSAGILLPISSLPSPYGIGCFSQEAYDFVDWLKEAGQTYWQILPLGVTGYQWWITRLWYCFELYDVVRIDHFRGFDEYFSIPYGSETAVDGHWEKGPGIELFRAVEQALGKREIIAEDLGYMSDTVRQLVRDSGFPGMKVLEFAFDSRDTGSASDYLPHNYPVNLSLIHI